MSAKAYRIIGHPTPYVDAKDKATGKTIYTSDIRLPSMLFGKVVRSTVPHGKILSVDTSAAKNLPGVKAVLTGADVPQNKYGTTNEDWHILAPEKVRFVGEEVAAVAAISKEIAEKAASLIKVEYEELPAVFDPREAAKPGAPVINEQAPDNVASVYKTNVGDVDKALAESYLVVEEDFYTSQVYQAYMETMGAVAKPEADGRLTLYLPIQIPSKARLTYAKALGMPVEKLHTLQPPTGGAFGAKMENNIHLIAGLLALKTGLPVQIMNDREEDFCYGNPRVPIYFHLKVGFSKEGRITAKDLTLYSGSGGRAMYGVPITGTACFRNDQLYKIPNVRAVGKLMYTNMVPTGCFRGFGNTQATFCLETVLDIAADKLQIDPADLRLRNAMEPGTVSIHGWQIDSCGLSDCIAKTTEAADWTASRKKSKERAGYGLGMACCNHVSGYSAFFGPFHGSAAVIRMNLDGTFNVMSGEVEIGQGQKTAFTMMAAEALGCNLEDVRLAPIDSDYTPFGLGCWASRSTALGGKAIENAAADLKQKVLDYAAEYTGIAAKKLHLEGKAVFDTDGNKVSDYADLGKNYLYKSNGGYLYGMGYVNPGTVVPDPKTKYGNPSITYPFACHVAEVEVDMETGLVNVLNYVATHDAGTIINPMAAEGQIEGGVSNGLGWALTENLVYNNGRLVNKSFLDYRVPGAKDMPYVKSLFVETKNPKTGFGAKGLGEPAINPVAAAIGNAIYDAIGVRLLEMPFTPDKILAAIKAKNA